MDVEARRYSITTLRASWTPAFFPRTAGCFAAPLEERVAAGQTNETVRRGIQVWETATGKR